MAEGTAYLEEYIHETSDVEVRIKFFRIKRSQDQLEIAKLVREYLEISAKSRYALQAALRALRKEDAVFDFVRLGDMLRWALEEVLEVGGVLVSCLKSGGVGERETEVVAVQHAIDEVADVRGTFLKHWPHLDSNALKEANASIRRGECRPLEDFLDELQAEAG